MKRAAAIVGWAVGCLAMQWQARAGEGRIDDAAALSPDPSRQSNYVGGPARDSAAHAKTTKDAGVAHKSRDGALIREKRSPAIVFSHRFDDFYIYDAGSRLITDRDDDAYHSEFRIRFDADATFGDALVYAKLYLRRIGEPDWLLYHITEDFWIYGESSSDDYFVTTTLDDGFPTSEYDILIDLYEVGFDGLVATLGPQDSGALSLLPLEESALDVPIEIAGYAVGDVTTTLLLDEDEDGHYSRFRIEFDPDSDFAGTWLFAKIWVRAQGGEWIEEHVSDDFLVDASGTADVYSLTADWISGYPTAFYDVQIDLHDAATGLLAATAGSDRPELSRVPLEDESRDARPNPPTGGGGGGDSTSRERGGGALTLWWLLTLAPLALKRFFISSAPPASRSRGRLRGCRAAHSCLRGKRTRASAPASR